MRARKGKIENYKVIRGSNTEDPNKSGENNLIINDDNSVESLKTGISKSRRGTKQEDNSEEVDTNTQKRKSRRSFPVMDMEQSDVEHEGEYITNTRVPSGKRLPVAKGKVAANGANKRVHGSDKTAIKYQKKKGKRGRKQDEDDDEDDEEKEEVYEVESIVEAKLHRGKRLFKIRWKGFGPENDSWEPEAKLSCEELIKQYFEGNPDISANNKTKKRSHDMNNGRKRIKGDAQGNVLKDEDGGDTQDYEVEKIMEVHFKKNRNREFLIHWKGFHHSENTWEPEENLNCPELIDKFMAKVDKAKCSSAPELRVNPQHTKHFTLNTQQAGRRLSRRNEGKQRATYYSCM